ncbi:hypothetical protein [Novosphingobium sp.]|uniref:hypothetical protein n=1 Tax=Novosphingobium sp. TaxID=1874826 RepID=UPI0035B493D2
MRSTQQTTKKRSAGTAAVMLAGAVGLLALPSAVLAFSSSFDIQSEPTRDEVHGSGFMPTNVDPRLARSVTVRALSKGRTFRFTPAASGTRMDRSLTVAVRLDANSTRSRSGNVATLASVTSPLRIAPTAYSLGTTRGYRGFAQNSKVPAPTIRRIEMPDLASFQPKSGTAAAGDPSRFAPRIALDEREKSGRSPRTFEQSDQTVDVGGSYRVTGNLNVTAGVRYTSDRDRLVPLTDGRQDSQSVYLGTQFRF